MNWWVELRVDELIQLGAERLHAVFLIKTDETKSKAEALLFAVCSVLSEHGITHTLTQF